MAVSFIKKASDFSFDQLLKSRSVSLIHCSSTLESEQDFMILCGNICTTELRVKRSLALVKQKCNLEISTRPDTVAEYQ